MKTLLIVSGGREAVGAANLAKRLGYYVVVSDSEMEAPAFAHADSCLIADWRSQGETPAAAERFNRKVRRIDGVVNAERGGTAAAAETCERLALVGLSRDAARLTDDRLLARERLKAAGVPVPWFSPAATLQALQRIAIERGTPLVVKPADGHRGYPQLVGHVEELEDAYYAARGQSPTHRVMAEDFMAGDQLTVASVVVNGECQTIAIADRIMDQECTPFLVQTGGAMPSTLAPDLLAGVKEIVAQAVAAFGIGSAVVEAELAVVGDTPHVLSVDAGLPGCLWSRQVALSTGVDLRAAAMKFAVGDALTVDSLIPNSAHPAVAQVLFAPPGQIIRINGAETACDVPGVKELLLQAQPGDISRPAEALEPAATVLATGPSRKAAEKAARDALSLVHIETA